MRYVRYQIPSAPAPLLAKHPSRFKVRISRLQLAKLLLRELIQYRGDLKVVLSRPCVYGVFSGPTGGFIPREQLCVGCLRCTIQHPEVVQIVPNPARQELGDSYFDPEKVETILYEAATGRVPVRGAGYGDGFGGTGWDGMWTDMSEIVRPTRDGIHGRETISTAVDIGRKPAFLEFDSAGELLTDSFSMITLPIPLIFDWIPGLADEPRACESLYHAAETLQTLMIAPASLALELGGRAVPLVGSEDLDQIMAAEASFAMLELDGWNALAYQQLRAAAPNTVIAVRLGLGESIVSLAEQGVGVFHLAADYHGRSEGRFAMQAIRDAHEQLVEAGLREQVTLIGSGGIIAAEHVPKAIISGLDAVALDTALLISWQAQFKGELERAETARFGLPSFEPGWGTQRVLNLMASWRDQLLEVLGAMGLREVRRLRGELGRAMFQEDLEQEAFSEIAGYGRGSI